MGCLDELLSEMHRSVGLKDCYRCIRPLGGGGGGSIGIEAAFIAMRKSYNIDERFSHVMLYLVASLARAKDDLTFLSEVDVKVIGVSERGERESQMGITNNLKNHPDQVRDSWSKLPSSSGSDDAHSL